MKVENYYCSFCGVCGEVVLLGEVAGGLENVRVYVCPECTRRLVEFWATRGEVGKTGG